MDWEECKEKMFVKKISEDKNLIDSLLKSSKNKLKSANRLEIDKTTAASVFSLCYDSLRELLEALSIHNGLKIYNHECYYAFLKEKLNDEKKALLFDKLRKIRNGINYYGRSLSAKDAGKLKREIKVLISEINILLRKN